MIKDAHSFGSDRRQYARRPVALRAFGVAPGGEVADVQLSDLSYEGCQVEWQAAPKRGERVELRVVRLGIVTAEVRWSRSSRAGCRFMS